MAQSKRWHAPYYWAGFVIQGEYNELENMGRRSLTTHKQAAVLIALASTLLLTFFVFRRRLRRII